MKLWSARPALSGNPVSLLQWQESEANEGNDGETGEKGYFSGGGFQDAVYCAKYQDTCKKREMRVSRPAIVEKSALQSGYQTEDVQHSADGPQRQEVVDVS